MVKSEALIVTYNPLLLSHDSLELTKIDDKERKHPIKEHPFKAAFTECVKCGIDDITTFNCENYLCHNCLKIPWISIPYHPKQKLDKVFHYMASDGLNILRVKQLLTLHYIASKMKYDSDTLYLVQQHLVKENVKPEEYSLNRVIELRESTMYHNSSNEHDIEYVNEHDIEHVNDYRIPPDSWEDE